MQTPELDRIPEIQGSISRSQDEVGRLPQLGQLNTHDQSSAYANSLAYGIGASLIATQAPPGLASGYLKDQSPSSPNGSLPGPSLSGGHVPDPPAQIGETFKLPPGHGFIANG